MPSMSNSDTSTASVKAEKYRLDGNSYFKKSSYSAAIDAYTKAIELYPDEPTYWSNRAVCYRKRNDWTKVEEDCRRTLQLDSHSTKAHCLLGLALLERLEYKEGIAELEKALELSRGTKGDIEEIWPHLVKAKYMLWKCESSQRSWDLQTVKMECFKALKEKLIIDATLAEGFISETLAFEATKRSEALERVFTKASQDDNPCEWHWPETQKVRSGSNTHISLGWVPDYLCCKITLDIFRDPVIAPSGFTYERSAILEHLQKVGKFDPITRKSLNSFQLIPNLAVKEAVRVFLDKHGWAYGLY